MRAGATGAPASRHHAQGNRLWATLPAMDRERLAPQLRSVRVDAGEVLVEAGTRIASVYFPTTAVVSIVCVATDGASLEVGMAGCDGAIGIDSLLGAELSAHRAVVHSAGSVCVLTSSALLSQAAASSEMSQMLLRYAQSFYAEVAQTAVCNRHHSVEQRFCRWLLASLERSNSSERDVSQELIASMLGVRRESVTEVVGKLRRHGLIAASRGHITILDRDALGRYACGCRRAASVPARKSPPSRLGGTTRRGDSPASAGRLLYS